MYDQLMNTLDPKLVKMQFQVSVISLGYEAGYLSDKVSGPVSVLASAGLVAHRKEGRSDRAGHGRLEEDLRGGQEQVGIKNYFVELNMEYLKPSYDYLHSLNV